MPFTRRQFVTSTLAGGFATLLLKAGAVEADVPQSVGKIVPPLGLPLFSGEKFTLENVQAAHFQACLKTTFLVTDDQGTQVSLELVEVAEKFKTAQIENFSLVFAGPLQPALSQKTYSFQHAKLGEISMFIVPVGQTAQAMRYEAVFNRLRS